MKHENEWVLAREGKTRDQTHRLLLGKHGLLRVNEALNVSRVGEILLRAEASTARLGGPTQALVLGARPLVVLLELLQTLVDLLEVSLEAVRIC